jgi:hypothetical protein
VWDFARRNYGLYGRGVGWAEVKRSPIVILGEVDRRGNTGRGAWSGRGDAFGLENGQLTRLVESGEEFFDSTPQTEVVAAHSVKMGNALIRAQTD